MSKTAIKWGFRPLTWVLANPSFSASIPHKPHKIRLHAKIIACLGDKSGHTSYISGALNSNSITDSEWRASNRHSKRLARGRLIAAIRPAHPFEIGMGHRNSK